MKTTFCFGLSFLTFISFGPSITASAESLVEVFRKSSSTAASGTPNSVSHDAGCAKNNTPFGTLGAGGRSAFVKVGIYYPLGAPNGTKQCVSKIDFANPAVASAVSETAPHPLSAQSSSYVFTSERSNWVATLYLDPTSPGTWTIERKNVSTGAVLPPIHRAVSKPPHNHHYGDRVHIVVLRNGGIILAQILPGPSPMFVGGTAYLERITRSGEIAWTRVVPNLSVSTVTVNNSGSHIFARSAAYNTFFTFSFSTGAQTSMQVLDCYNSGELGGAGLQVGDGDTIVGGGPNAEEACIITNATSLPRFQKIVAVQPQLSNNSLMLVSKSIASPTELKIYRRPSLDADFVVDQTLNVDGLTGFAVLDSNSLLILQNTGFIKLFRRNPAGQWLQTAELLPSSGPNSLYILSASQRSGNILAGGSQDIVGLRVTP